MFGANVSFLPLPVLLSLSPLVPMKPQRVALVAHDAPGFCVSVPSV